MSLYSFWKKLMLYVGRLFGFLGIITTGLLMLSVILDFLNGSNGYATSIVGYILTLSFLIVLFVLCLFMVKVKKLL